jgi:hypothetical protein
MQLQTLSRTHKADNKQLPKSHGVLQVPMMPNNARYLGLVLFILGSWLAIVVDVFILLDSRFSWKLMAVGGEVAGGVELPMRSWEVQIFRPSCITSHAWEVFRAIAEVCRRWHTRPTNLVNISQANKYLVLGDCKSASPGRNKVSFLTEPLVSTKGKIFGSTLLSL